MNILLANPRGFCAGVDRAIEIVEVALERYGAPIYVRHEVVHNVYVVSNLKERGAIFVDEISEVPDDNIVVFSAHGVSQAVRDEAKERNLKLVLDATCPLVTKVHMEVMRHAKRDSEVVLIGHAGHAEVEGTLGQYDNSKGGIYLVESVEDVANLSVKNPDNLAYVTQTTLSVDETKDIVKALQEKFPNINGPRKDDICYATQNRQDAVRVLAKDSDVVLVVGSRASSNSNRLRELAELSGCKSYLIDSKDELDPQWLSGVNNIGITAGASAPEVLVKSLIEHIKLNWNIESVKEVSGKEETITFSLPKELRVTTEQL